MKTVSPLFAYAYDGVAFYKAVMKRLHHFPDLCLTDFCRLAGIEFSTAWRWRKGSIPDSKTINAIEKAFGKLEK